jgi:PelA/Pel-15E family pectate lyase
MRLALLTLVAATLPLHPAVIGTSLPAESLTAARVTATLPAPQQKPWLDYLKRSAQQLSFDQDELWIERSHLSGPVPDYPKEGNSARSMSATQDPAFYKTPEALKVADNIVSFQLPNGGWSKNLDMTAGPRLSGQSFTPNNISRFLSPDDFDKPANPNWNYAGTLDNDATNTELHYLARISSAYPGHSGDRFRAAYLRGIYYLLDAQYPNGGWPQVWPLEGGYHDAITFNDNAVTESVSTLTDVAAAQGDLTFIPADLRTRAAAAAQRGIAIILQCQMVLTPGKSPGAPFIAQPHRAMSGSTDAANAGTLTIWAQQHDPLTLIPVSGRNYEPAALSAGESADILVFLMKLPHPTPEIRASIEAGIAWLKANAIYGQAFVGGRGPRPAPGQPPAPVVPRHLEAQAGAGPIWARYYSLTTGKPIFGDRDKTIHDTVDGLSIERKNGYAWYSPGAQSALEAYAAWHSK